jgi:hypothetical protein
MRGGGLISGATGMWVSECEAFGNNLSNTASIGGFMGAGDYQRCISHDNTGSNTAGFFLSSAIGNIGFTNCIADTNGGIGFNVTTTGANLHMHNCDAYNNTSDGIRSTASKGTLWIENCNLIKNGGWGINFATSTNAEHFLYNCAFGAGTQVNTSGTTTGIYTGQEIGSITYASNVTPWVDPANGDFRINLSTANFAGRAAFTETASSYAGAVGYPDIGACQSLTGPGGTFTKAVSYGFGS